MKVLVTGGTGFLGWALTKRLLELGHEVTSMGRNKKLGKYISDRGVFFLEGNLEDRAYVRKCCKGQDVVFHCGAKSSPWGSYESFYKANVKGTEHVIEGCREHGVKRLVHVSSPSICFRYDERKHVREEDRLPLKKANDYAETKAIAESKIEEAYRNGLPVITIRPRAIFGPGDTTILPRLIRLNESRFIPLVRKGRAELDLTYIDNVVDALILCMNADESLCGNVYHITNGERVVLKEVLQELFLKLGTPFRKKNVPYQFLYLAGWMCEKGYTKKEPPLTRYTVSVLGNTQTLSIEKAKRELGYEPRVSVREGVDRFVEWWKEKEQGSPY
ncbi:NAD(P)-dependent oxidoreductase (plasmid) [Pontibacillus sp. ALD_SL1]|uniref:NAD-dependent epimerase/dehydratase family protein n=1 Tax=Pontibacillus sp. ALD_SL1 TaxID=2777185 RepID=UPI001A969BF9|nr:NAD(P)-dependent oxidoreductase [Pontibacillus sp. ALD_SL1]QST02102.1 NAD(P)-dependent oxidoreductase [Pontibacillus sp. ALD_SL1]